MAVLQNSRITIMHIHTSFKATPPRFFSELNGNALIIEEFDLTRSKFIPS